MCTKGANTRSLDALLYDVSDGWISLINSFQSIVQIRNSNVFKSLMDPDEDESQSLYLTYGKLNSQALLEKTLY